MRINNIFRRHQSSSFLTEQIRMTDFQRTNDESRTTATVATSTPTTVTTTTTTAASGQRVLVDVQHHSLVNNDMIATQPTGSSPFNSSNNLLNFHVDLGNDEQSPL